MKTSYKLYGSAWDRQPIHTKCLVIKTPERSLAQSVGAFQMIC